MDNAKRVLRVIGRILWAIICGIGKAFVWCLKNPKEALYAGIVLLVVLAIVSQTAAAGVVNSILMGVLGLAAALWRLEAVHYLLALTVIGTVVYGMARSFVPKKGKKK